MTTPSNDSLNQNRGAQRPVRALSSAIKLGSWVGLLALASGCAGAPAAPFDTLKTSQTTAFRLQNYEPPAAAAAAAQPGTIPGLPPEIQQWVQAGAQGLQQLIPPGLLPPGLLGGAPAAPLQAQPDAPRFPMTAPNFRILSQTPVMDEGLREDLGKLFGDDSNFDSTQANCMYAEMGLAFSSNMGNNELLISFSCNRVEARGFAWPHPNTGMKPNTVKKLSEVVSKLFPPGT